jgi:hypothetical protein
VKLRWSVAVAVAAALIVTGQVAPARADCVDDCERAYGGYGTDESLKQLQTCYDAQCNHPQVRHGAIAYSEKNGAYGFSYDMESASGADNRALTNCTRNGEGCKVVASFANHCAALAAAADNHYAVIEAGTRAKAQAGAMTACGRKGTNCDIKVWSCAQP